MIYFIEINQVLPPTQCCSIFLKNHKGDLSQKSPETRDYWLITPNQLTLCIETNIF